METYAQWPLPYVSGIDVLYAQIRRWVPIYTSWHGQASIYITGPYVLVQERKHVHGLRTQFRGGHSLGPGAAVSGGADTGTTSATWPSSEAGFRS